jgi:hypothetical protein
LKKIFYPKIFFPTVKLLFVVTCLFFFFYIILRLFEKQKVNIDSGFLFSAFFMILFFGYFAFHLSYFFCFYFKYIIIEHNQVSIFELNKLKTTKANFEEILGYSKSEVHFGRYTWKTKSIIIYYKSGKTSEILNSFVSDLDFLEQELKNKKIKYLGFENYDTGWFFRKYKYFKH